MTNEFEESIENYENAIIIMSNIKESGDPKIKRFIFTQSEMKAIDFSLHVLEGNLELFKEEQQQK